MPIMKTIIVFILCLVGTVCAEELDQLSDEFINLINKKQNKWIAGRNFPSDTPLDYFKKLTGTLLDDHKLEHFNVIEHSSEVIDALPESFDAREKWPNCPSLNEIRDQGSCGSCWAVGAVEVMTDRVCIRSNATKHFHFSAENVINCCGPEGGCNGGGMSTAWEYWLKFGIVSGGNYNSSQGCMPYSHEPCEHGIEGKLKSCIYDPITPKCVKKCQSGYNVTFEKDIIYGKHIYTIREDEVQIQAEIFKNGPVEAGFLVYSDLIHYKKGVYEHVSGDVVGKHAIKILGWGVENGIKYWLIANSWNSEWGYNGYFKIIRGINHCNIESDVVAGEPLL